MFRFPFFVQGSKYLQRKKILSQRKRWWRRLGGMRIRPIEWNYPLSVASVSVWFYCLKRMYLFPSLMSTPVLI